MFAVSTFGFFVFSERLGILLFTLDIELYYGSVFGTVCGYTGFGLSNVYVVNEVESFVVVRCASECI